MGNGRFERVRMRHDGDYLIGMGGDNRVDGAVLPKDMPAQCRVQVLQLAAIIARLPAVKGRPVMIRVEAFD